jgi:hypothetical protein
MAELSPSQLRRGLIDELQKIDPRKTAQVELDHFVQLARHELQPNSYKQIHVGLLQIYTTIREKNQQAASLYLKYMLNELVANFRLEEARIRLPQTICDLYIREISRIRDQLTQLNLEYYDFDNDPFVKDFALLTHRFVPVGAEFAVPFSGVPRRTLFQGGIRQFFRTAGVIMFRTCGFEPFFSLHAHPLALYDFNPEGWENTYHRLAQLLELNPTIKGITSASWFLDPQLESISPHLTYLREVPEQNGAAFFFVGYDYDGTSGALARSASRRRLFHEGHYVPAIYMRVWPRDDILKWSQKNKKAWVSNT